MYVAEDMRGDVHAWRANVRRCNADEDMRGDVNVCRCNADEDMYGDVCRRGHVWRCMPMGTCMAMYADGDMHGDVCR